MVATLRLINIHPAKTTVTLPNDGYSVVHGTPLDLIAEGLTSSNALDSLLDGDIYSAIQAKFLALQFVADVDTLSPTASQKNRLLKAGILNPFTNGAKQEPATDIESGDDFYSVATVSGDINVLTLFNEPTRLVVVGGAGNLVCTSAKPGATQKTIYGLAAGTVLPLKLIAISSTSTVTNLTIVR